MWGLKPILLVEDDQVDAMTLKRALSDLGVTNALVHLTDGEKALGYLRTKGNKLPCFIFLDLNMPRMNGVEFLQIVKADKKLKKIPVVVLTTSRNEKDILESYELSVAGYVVKPADYEEFVDAIRTVYQYCSLIELPVKG